MQPSLPDTCRHPGCTQLRSKYSVFCEVHHRLDLRRADGLSEREEAYNDYIQSLTGVDLLRHKCRKLCKNHRRRAITDDELTSQLCDLFVHEWTMGEEEDVQTVLRSLPTDVLPGMLRYIEARPGPRVFFRSGPPMSDEERIELERKSLIAKENLIRILRST